MTGARLGEATPTINACRDSADKNGVIYGAEVGEKALKRYVKK